jgi:hypothetical protein
MNNTNTTNIKYYKYSNIGLLVFIGSICGITTGGRNHG